jgi:hypothetical protein
MSHVIHHEVKLNEKGFFKRCGRNPESRDPVGHLGCDGLVNGEDIGDDIVDEHVGVHIAAGIPSHEFAENPRVGVKKHKRFSSEPQSMRPIRSSLF